MSSASNEELYEDREAVELGDLADQAVFDGEINDDDIVFDCEHCGHTLVINYRGAGLVINCAECGEPVEVPIPDGMELGDLDQSPEELQSQLTNMRRALFKAEERERELGNLVNSLRERRTTLERDRTSQLHRLAEIRTSLDQIERLASDIGAICTHLAEVVQQELRQQ